MMELMFGFAGLRGGLESFCEWEDALLDFRFRERMDIS
jgi:hypothetical protein